MDKPSGALMSSEIRKGAIFLLSTLLSVPSGLALAQGGGWAEVPDATMVETFGMSADDVEAYSPDARSCE